MSSIKCKIGQFHVVVVQKTPNKCMKKVWCTCKVVVLPFKPVAFFSGFFCFFFRFLTFSLPWRQRIVKSLLVKSLLVKSLLVKSLSVKSLFGLLFQSQEQ